MTKEELKEYLKENLVVNVQQVPSGYTNVVTLEVSIEIEDETIADGAFEIIL